jgi:hypothetical protein
VTGPYATPTVPAGNELGLVMESVGVLTVNGRELDAVLLSESRTVHPTA